MSFQVLQPRPPKPNPVRRAIAVVMDVCFWLNFAMIGFFMWRSNWKQAGVQGFVAICCWIGGELNREPSES